MVGYTYILTNRNNTTLYVGASADLKERSFIHKTKLNPRSFVSRYNLVKLIYYEIHEDLDTAFFREKQIKNLVRRKKNKLINSFNPNWKDLYEEIIK